MARGNNKSKQNRNFSKKYSIKHKKSLSSRNSNVRLGQKKHNKRKYSDSKYNLADSTKRQKIESLAEKVSSSESEQEEDVVKQLLGTFNVDLNRKNTAAIESEDSDTSEDQNDSQEISKDYSDYSVSNEERTSIEESKTKVKSEEIENYTEEHQESEEENEIDQETLNEENEFGNDKDPFVKHLCYDLHENLLESLQSTNKKDTINLEWPELGKLTFTVPKCESNEAVKSNFTITEEKQYAPLGKVSQKIDKKTIDSSELSIKTQIQNHIRAANKSIKSEEKEILSSFQCELFSIVNNYQDLYYSNRTLENSEEIRFVYSLHSINHVLKTRTKILHHNARLQKKDEVPEEYRDQGLVRPKVLILVPFRDSALKIINMLIDLLVPNDKGQVINKNRFLEDYTGGELIFPKRNPKPEDYERTFTGNCDDTFKIGIKVTKKSLKLYSDFYSSDIIIASPLGLRLTIGAEGEKDRDYDFLASIELLILDQTEIFLMQNWDHLIHTLNHIHMQPKQTHGTDFSRVRSWVLNGWSKYYRQTLIFSSVVLPEINSIFNKKCHNFAGAVKTVNSVCTGAIVNVCVQVPQVYRKFEVDNVLNAINNRFELFVEKILPQYRDNIMKQCLIYIPNYFDYVRVRNYFKREDIGFVQICEYSKDAKVARARDMFFHGDAHFLLYSERFHFFRRIRIKGIRHIIFYQPPTFPHFYSELCNFMQEANQNRKCGSTSNMTVTVIYSKYDLQQVAAIVGTDRLMKMTSSTKNFHMFTNSDT